MPNAIRANSSGRLLRVLLIVNGVLLLFPAIVVVDMFGLIPAFAAEFAVENASGQHIRVTPLGSLSGEGEPHYLPLLEGKPPARRSRRWSGFELAPGEQRAFFYDMDDASLTDILIEADGRVLQLSVSDGLNTPPPSDKRIIVSDLDRLPLAKLEVADLARDHGSGDWVLRWRYLIPAPTFVMLLILRWRSRGRPSCPTTVETIPA